MNPYYLFYTALILVCCLAIFLPLAISSRLVKIKNRNERLLECRKEYKKAKSDPKSGIYDLIAFDNGQHWYKIQKVEGGFIIPEPMKTHNDLFSDPRVRMTVIDAAYPLRGYKAEMNFYNRLFLRRQGGGTLCGYYSYRVYSFDGGRTWYAVNENRETRSREIVDLAEIIYPGLLNNLEAWNALSDYVSENGPIGQNGTINFYEKRLLESVGFQVKG